MYDDRLGILVKYAFRRNRRHSAQVTGKSEVIGSSVLVPINALGLTDLANFRVVGNPEVIPPIFRKILAAAAGRTSRSVPVLLQFANPNIAIADWVIVVLQRKRQLFWSGLIGRTLVMACRSGWFDVILH